MIQLVFAHCGHSFGTKTGMPWPHISRDFKNFKARTEGTTLIMGAKTFTTLPSLLPGRKHIVVYDPTRSKPVACDGSVAHQYISINSFERMIENNKDTDKMFSVIGGKDLLEKALPFAKRVIRTNIKLGPFDLDQNVTQFLSADFLCSIDKRCAIESHWYKINSTTEIIETIYE